MSTDVKMAGEPPQATPDKPGAAPPPRSPLLIVFIAFALGVLGLTFLARRIVERRALATYIAQQALIDRATANPGAPLADPWLPPGVLVVDLVPLSSALGFGDPATVVIDGKPRTWDSDVRARFENLSPERRYAITVRGPYVAEPLTFSLPSASNGARVALRAIPLTPPPVTSTELLPYTPEKMLIVDMSRRDDGYDLRWVQGPTTVVLVELPRTTLGLAEKITLEWKQQGGHRDPSDKRVDQAMIRVSPGASFREVLAVAMAILSPTREVRYPEYRTIPAFDLTVDITTPVEAQPDPMAAELAAAEGRPPTAAKVRMGALQVSGRLPPAVIQRIVRQNFGRVRLCYDIGLRKDPYLHGRVAVRFVVGADGAVSTVSDGGSDMPDAAVTKCIVRSFSVLSFPRPEGGIVTATYPFILSPS